MASLKKKKYILQKADPSCKKLMKKRKRKEMKRKIIIKIKLNWTI